MAGWGFPLAGSLLTLKRSLTKISVTEQQEAHSDPGGKQIVQSLGPAMKAALPSPPPPGFPVLV